MRSSLLAFGLLALAANAQADWELIRIAAGTSVAGTRATVGSSHGGSFDGRAILWTGTAGPSVDLTPDGATEATVFGMHGGWQVGSSLGNGVTHAAIWSGTLASYRNLNPAGAADSEAIGVRGNQVVGYASYDIRHAAAWDATTGAHADLAPGGATSSTAFASDSVNPYGVAVFDGAGHAIRWKGATSDYDDLMPTGARRSSIQGYGDGQAIGSATFGDINRAGYWTGGADSFVDLHNEAFTFSEGWGAAGGFQVGYVSNDDGLSRATLWSGTKSSYLDLGAFASGDYDLTEAYGVAVDETGVWVAGIGYNRNSNAFDALLWHRPTPVPEPASLLVLGLGTFAFLRRRPRTADDVTRG